MSKRRDIKRYICDCCGESINENKIINVDDQYYCKSCAEECTSICPITNERHLDIDMERIYIIDNIENPSCEMTAYISIEGIKKMITDYGVKVYGYEHSYMFVDLNDFPTELRKIFEYCKPNGLEHFAKMSDHYNPINKENLVVLDIENF